MRHAYGRPVSLSDVAARANLSPYHFLRVYKRAYGETPHEFLTRLRIERAKTLLAKGSHNVTEACFEVGFSSLGSFSTCSRIVLACLLLSTGAMHGRRSPFRLRSGRCSFPLAFSRCCTDLRKSAIFEKP
jgi:AraC-like DNA-binding protein